MNDAEHARSRLAYDPETGQLTWKVAPRYGINIGDVAGGGLNQGYARVKLFGKQHLAHRVVWLIVHGRWPTEQIDHINGNRADNRLANLREVSGTVNSENRRGPQTNSKSGILGVSFQDGKYKARIRVNRQYIYLGFYDTAEEASEAYLRAKRQHHAGCTL